MSSWIKITIHRQPVTAGPDMSKIVPEVLVAMRLLNGVFLNQHAVFSGKISQFVALGQQVNISEERIRASFKGLAGLGFITITGDRFTPLQPLIDIFH
ncbi:MAG: hypothetical protein WAV56_00145 [Microgenomates group bacterium]